MRAWLPQSAFAQCSPEPSLLRVLRQWSDEWLIAAEPGLMPIYQDNHPAPVAAMKWRSSASVSIAYRDGILATLGSAMLGCSIVSASLQPSDRRILERLTGRALDDLLCRLSILDDEKAEPELNSAAIPLDGAGWWEVSLAPGKPAFKLASGSSFLVRLIKRELPANPRPDLSSLADGLAGQNVSLSTTLGRCNLSLADLKGLGIGDVLVLDRLTEAPVDVMVDGRPSLFRANLEEGDGRATLHIASQG